jgi:hypothetical protein
MAVKIQPAADSGNAKAIKRQEIVKPSSPLM